MNLRKMYLVFTDHRQRPLKPTSSSVEMQAKCYIQKKKKQRHKQQSYDKWVAFRENIRE
jgi:hypothetical protein